ncbi:MAG: VOC family protein [Ruegeria sp.]
MRISALRLRVADPSRLAEFYRVSLGMTVCAEGDAWRVGYPGPSADLLLIPGGGGYVHERGQRYWKIGITLPDVDRVADHLRDSGISVSRPAQFQDIGYMCHLSDPEGFVIELLQHDFEGKRPGTDVTMEMFDRAAVGQITLRTGDILVENAFCRSLGLRLLSMQDVASHGFDLHFYAFTSEVPPDTDLWAVANREWLWKRPYTTLEYQHIPDAVITRSPDFLGIDVEGLTQMTIDALGSPFLPA